MSKYTVEQVRDRLRSEEKAAIPLALRREYKGMADAIDALLRERELAKAAVTEEIALKLGLALADAANKYGYFTHPKALQETLEAVAPMLTSARVPEETTGMLQEAWQDIAKISGSALLAGEKKSQTEEQRGIVYKLACSALAAIGCVYQEITGRSPMLAAVPKPEKEHP